MIIDIIIAIIFTEAVTELCVKSDFFSPFREYLFNHRSNKLFNFLHKLFDCGYCLSVWVGFLSLFLVYFINSWISFFIIGIIIHRLSNFFHFVIDRVRG